MVTLYTLLIPAMLAQFPGDPMPARSSTADPAPRIQTAPEPPPVPGPLPRATVTQPTQRIGAPLLDNLTTVNEEQLRWHIPDPEEALNLHARALSEAQAGGLRPDATYHRRVQDLLKDINRPGKLRVPLAEVLRRALANSLAIRVESYNPAIDATRVVEAEAAFDAAFFTNVFASTRDQPSPSRLQGNKNESVEIEGGVRKLLPSGMNVSISQSLTRTATDNQFQTLNPAYFSQFNVQFRQPILRGFGLDYNRSQINITKNDQRISDLAFRRRIRDTLFEAERAYWDLWQARRLVPISARLIADFEQIYEYLYERRDFDVLQIQMSETLARLEATKADHLRILNNVRDAEDRLIALVNDPTVNLAEHDELVPTDQPVRGPLVIDRFAEMQAALDHREEIKEAKLQIGNAKLLVGVAKNQALPRADLTFQYSVDGLGISADDAFDEVTKNDFTEYAVGVEFELPIGNRAARGRERGARLQHAQSIAGLKQIFEQVLLDVNVAVRALQTSFDVIGPNYASMEASQDRLDSIKARAEKKDFLQLSNELSAHQSLSQARIEMLRAITTYTTNIVSLEQAKGTLLEYDGVSIVGETERKPESPTPAPF